MSFVQHYVGKGADHVNWMFNHMDITQWGLVSAVMVTLGFIAIKYR